MNHNNNTKLFSNFISLSIVQGANFLLPLLVIPYVIRIIGIKEFGVIAIAQVVMLFLSTVSDYGFNLTATKEIALCNGDRKKISAIFFTVLPSKLIIMMVLFVLLLLVSLFTPFLQDHLSLYLLGFTYVAGQTLFVNWFYQGVEKMYYITLITFISKLVFVALVFLFIHKESDKYLFLFFFGIGNILGGAISILIAIIGFRLTFLHVRWSNILHELKTGWQITLSNLSIITCLYCGIFILRLFTNDVTVGYYSIAERIFFAVRQILAVYSQAIYPNLCQLSYKGKDATSLFFRQMYLPFLLCTFIGCCLLYVLAPEIVSFFIKGNSSISVTLLRMFSVAPFIVCLNIPAYQLLLAFDQKKSFVTVFSVATVVYILSNMLLITVLGAAGAVVSVIITETFITISLNMALLKNGLLEFLLPSKKEVIMEG